MFGAELYGLRELEAALKRTAEEAIDFRRCEGEIFDGISRTVERNFLTRGGLVGGWPPRKAVGIVTHPLMQESGELRNSLTRRGATGGVFEVTRDSVSYGSTLARARAHQRGVPSRNLPPRPVIPSAEMMAPIFQSIVRGDAVRFVKGLGFEVRD